MSNLLLMGIGGSGGGAAAGLAAGYYYQTGLSSPPPNPASGNGWVSTTKFDDVGVGDQTTYESGDGQGQIMVLLVLGASASRSGYTAQIWQEAPATYVAYYWTGAAWAAWGSPVVGGNLGHQWSAVTETLGAQSSQYFCFVFDDVASLDPPDAVRVGDWRVS
jgi:hypothetical protein